MADVELSTLGSTIKEAYEGQSNTNAFTDGEKTKLAGLSNAYGDLTGVPTFAPVATSGSYTDLTNQPDLFSGNFSDLVGTPEFIPASQKGAPGGVAPLDASGLVPLTHLNVSGLSFLGAWNAETNTPTLIDGTGTVGQFYKVSVPGTQNLGSGGTHSYVEGDWVIYAGGIWQRLVSSETVSAVNGYTGMVELDAEDVGALPDTYVPTWNSVTGKPSLVNSVNGQTGAVTLPAPAWDDITGKPDFGDATPMPQEMIGRPIYGALLNRTSNLTWAAAGGRRLMPMQAARYDIFNGWNGSSAFIIPEGFAFVRLSCSIFATTSSDGTNLAVEFRRNGVEMSVFNNKSAGSGFGLVDGVTPVEPVSPGDEISFYFGLSTNGTLHAETSRTWIQIELFQAVN